MENLIHRIGTLNLAPGKYGIRSHAALKVETDGAETDVQANVDTEFNTTSGQVQITVKPASVPIELWPIPAAPASVSVAGDTKSPPPSASNPAEVE